MLSVLWLTMMSMPTSVILSNSFPALEGQQQRREFRGFLFVLIFFSLNWEVGCRAKLFAAVSGLCRERFFVG